MDFVSFVDTSSALRQIFNNHGESLLQNSLTVLSNVRLASTISKYAHGMGKEKCKERPSLSLTLRLAVSDHPQIARFATILHIWYQFRESGRYDETILQSDSPDQTDLDSCIEALYCFAMRDFEHLHLPVIFSNNLLAGLSKPLSFIITEAQIYILLRSRELPFLLKQSVLFISYTHQAQIWLQS